MRKRSLQFILILGDIIILYLSLYLALFLRHRAPVDIDFFQKHLLPFSIIYFIWLIIFYIQDLYNLTLMRNTLEFYKKFLSTILINAAIAVGFFYLVPYFKITPKTHLFLNLIIFSLLFAVWRLISNKIIQTIGAINNLVLIGINSSSLDLSREILKHQELGYNLKTIYNLDQQSVPEWLSQKNVAIENNLSQLKNSIQEKKINTLVISNELYAEIFKNLYQLIPTGVDFYNLSTFWEKFYRSIPIFATNEIWFLENLHGAQKRSYEVGKRILDVLFGFIFGLVSLVFYPFIILSIKLNSPGLIFYQQKRTGKDNKEFKIIKFRTMVPGAEKNGPQWAEKNDARVTSFGKFLRKTRLDELPQLWNILKGEMSFIGPRPERPEFVEELSKKIPHYHLRHLIQPGLTGWAQINYSYGSSVDDAIGKLCYDLYYLKNRSFLLDLSITLKTIAIVFSRKGQ